MLKNALIEGGKFIAPNNAIGLVEFSTGVRKVLPLGEFNSMQKAKYETAINDMNASGNTAMIDGIVVSTQMLMEYKEKNPNCKPMLFVLTDGMTNRGLDYNAVKSVLASIEIPIYTIGYGENIDATLLKEMSGLNEASTMSAKDEEILYKIGTLLNAQM